MKRAIWIFALAAGCGRPAALPIAPVTGSVDAIALAGDDVVWIESSGSRVVRAPQTGGAPSVAADHQRAVGLAALDRDSVVWTFDFSSEALSSARLEKVPLAGGTPEPLARLRGPGPLAARDGSLYWISRTGADSVALQRFHDGRVDVLSTWSQGWGAMLPGVGVDEAGIAWWARGSIHHADAAGRGDTVLAASPREAAALASGGADRVAWIDDDPECRAIPNQAVSPPTMPTVWDRVERALGHEPLAGVPVPGEPIHFVSAGPPATVDAGMPATIAADAEGFVWMDLGDPMVPRGASALGNAQVLPCQEREPIPGTTRIVAATWDGRTRVIDRDDGFFPAVAIDARWIYAASPTKGLVRYPR